MSSGWNAAKFFKTKKKFRKPIIQIFAYLCFPESLSLLITLPRTIRLLFICFPSFNRTPPAPVLATLSDPAKSTKFCTKNSVNLLALKKLQSFILVQIRFTKRFKNSWKTSWGGDHRLLYSTSGKKNHSRMKQQRHKLPTNTETRTASELKLSVKQVSVPQLSITYKNFNISASHEGKK